MSKRVVCVGVFCLALVAGLGAGCSSPIAGTDAGGTDAFVAADVALPVDAPVLPTDAPAVPSDAPTADVGALDAACSGGACDDAGACATPDADGDGDDRVACGGGDCDDADSARSSLRSETCNAIDDDCDGTVDMFDEPCTGVCGEGTWTCVAGAHTTACNVAPQSMGCTTACGTGTTTCTGGGPWTACDAAVASEVCAGAECGMGTRSCSGGAYTACGSVSGADTACTLCTGAWAGARACSPTGTLGTCNARSVSSMLTPTNPLFAHSCGFANGTNWDVSATTDFTCDALSFGAQLPTGVYDIELRGTAVNVGTNHVWVDFVGVTTGTPPNYQLPSTWTLTGTFSVGAACGTPPVALRYRGGTFTDMMRITGVTITRR